MLAISPEEEDMADSDRISHDGLLTPILAMAEARSSEPAVHAAGTQWTYSELLDAAHQVQQRLQMLEGETGPVAFVAERICASPAFMLGALLAGRAFAPIDPADPDPEARARRMGSVRLIKHPGAFIEGAEALCFDTFASHITPPLSGTQAAYRLLTSGTSARAKLVEVSQANLSAYVKSACADLSLDRPMRWAVVSSLATDLSYTAIFPALTSGGCVHIVEDRMRRDGQAFRAFLQSRRIDAIKMTPAHCRALMADEPTGNSHQLALLVLGGEMLPPILAATMLDGGHAERVVNHYGPTETTIGVACHEIRSANKLDFDARSVPIGKPMGDAELFVVDDACRPVSLGETGELLIGGPTVANGYVGDPVLTQERFIFAGPDGREPRRFFRTHDFCRRLEDGSLEFKGRFGSEVKVRGWRVEPSDIEQAICALDGVQDARIIVDEQNGQVALDAVVAAGDQTAESVRATLAERVPRHLIPRRIAITTSLPLLLSGKFDQAAARHLLEQTRSVADSLCETDPLVVEIAGMMAVHLGGTRPGPQEDFADLGGDSLAAIHLLTQLQERGYEIDAETLLSDLTPGGVAASIRATGSNDARRDDIALQRRDGGGLSPAQRWFFAQGFPDPERWCQGIALRSAKLIDPDALEAAVRWIVCRHPLLHTRFESDRTSPCGWRCQSIPVTAKPYVQVARWNGSQTGLRALTDGLLAEMDIQGGRLFAAMRLDAPDGGGLVLLIAHHLVVDGVSWRILLDDLVSAYSAAQAGTLADPVPDPGIFWDWVDTIAGDTPSTRGLACVPHYKPADAAAVACYSHTATAAIDQASRRAGRGVHDALLAAFAEAWADATGEARLDIDIEHHGRTGSGAKVGRAVGWFTHTAPVALSAEPAGEFTAMLERAATALEDVAGEERAYAETAPICFNYLGRFASPACGGSDWSYAPVILGPLRGNNRRGHAITLSARIVGGRLCIDLVFDTGKLIEADGLALTNGIAQRLTAFAGGPEVDAPDIRLVPWSSVGQLALQPPMEVLPTRQASFFADHSPLALFLTGATGYLGAYLLREFLAGPASEVVCLVRPKEGQSGAARLAERYRWYFGADLADFSDRVRVVEGDVTLPGLGLPKSLYRKLASRLDTVVHSAADVRLFADERYAEEVNVQGADRVIAFAETGRPKVIHLVSTMSIAGLWTGSQRRIFAETDLDYGQKFRSAYEKSKLQAEECLRSFTARGGVGWSHRLGSLAAPVGPGRSQFDLARNRIAQTLRLYANCGAAPMLPGEQMLLTPVDLTARAIAELAARARHESGTTHLIDEAAADHDDVIETLKRIGHPVSLVSAKEFADRTRSEPNGALVRWWLTRGPRRVAFQARRTAALLEELCASVEVDCRRAWLERVVTDALRVSGGRTYDQDQ